MKEIIKDDQYAQILHCIFLFRGITLETAVDILHSSGCFCAEFESGEKIYTRVHFKKCLGVVLSGRLKAVKVTPGGSEVVMNTFFSGSSFGVAGFFSSQQNYVSEVISETHSKVLFLQEDLLKKLFRVKPEASENYIRFLTDRICYLNACIDRFTCGSSQNRLAEFLFSRSSHSADPMKFECPCSMSQLASTLGMGRASLYRAFRELEESGSVRREGRIIYINDLSGLKSGLR